MKTTGTCYVTALYNEHQSFVYDRVLRMTRSAWLAEEIVQEVFIKAWLYKDSLAGIADIKAWLFVTAKRKVYDYRAKKDRRLRLDAQYLQECDPPSFRDGLNNPVYAALEEKEYRQLYAVAVRRLPPQQRVVYLLKTEQRLKRRQIALQLRLSPHTISNHLVLATRSVRGFMMGRVA